LGFEAGDNNFYNYVGNAPNNRTDSSGLKYESSVDYVNKTITITIDISFIGDEEKSDITDRWMGDIKGAWEGKGRSKNGDEWKVIIKGDSEFVENDADSNYKNVITIMPRDWSESGSGRPGGSVLVGDGWGPIGSRDSGKWSENAPPWVIAHEGGHLLLGPKDYYSRDPKNNDLPVPWPGYEKTIMGDRDQGRADTPTPDGRSFRDILIDDIVNPRTDPPVPGATLIKQLTPELGAKKEHWETPDGKIVVKVILGPNGKTKAYPLE